MDMPRAAPELPRLVRNLDELVAHAAGRGYLAKDALLSPQMLRAMYPRLGEWQQVRDSERMREIAEDLTSAGTATADVAHLDADDLEPHAEAIAGAFRRLGRVHVVVRCVGALGRPPRLDADPHELARC